MKGQIPRENKQSSSEHIRWQTFDPGWCIRKQLCDDWIGRSYLHVNNLRVSAPFAAVLRNSFLKVARSNRRFPEAVIKYRTKNSSLRAKVFFFVCATARQHPDLLATGTHSMQVWGFRLMCKTVS
jgi:hypothetical protein